MDTLFLESLVTVVESGSIAEAARRLNLTPGAVAQRLRALEGELGIGLVIRSGRTVRPTEAGMKIVLRARNLLRDIRDLRVIANDGLPAGEFKLGSISTALTGIVPKILGQMVNRYQQIEFFIQPGVSENLYQKVYGGDLDAAIIVQPQFDIPKACNWMTLRREPLVVLVPAALRGGDPHQILSTQPFIRYDRNQWGGKLAEKYLDQAGLKPRDRFELDALDAIAVMVDQGLGVSLVPDWAEPWPQGLSVAKISLPDSSHTRQIGVIWRSGSARIPLVQAFLEQAAQALGVMHDGFAVAAGGKF
jgi:DNA-binding transcriptional LysR family regulator